MVSPRDAADTAKPVMFMASLISRSPRFFRPGGENVTRLGRPPRFGSDFFLLQVGVDLLFQDLEWQSAVPEEDIVEFALVESPSQLLLGASA